jgi:hypothetical protein
MVGNAVTAFAFSRARLIGAGAFSFVGFNLAFHQLQTPFVLKVGEQSLSSRLWGVVF